MLEKKLTDLLNQELDGSNSEKERAAVKKLLAKNSEARRYFEELQSMKALFRQVRDVEPPPYLRNRILNTLPVRRRRRSPVSSLPFLHALTANARYRYITTFVGGAVAGILLFAMFATGPSEPGEAVGTMANQPGVVVEVEASQSIESAQATGTFSAKRAGPLVTADLRLQTSGPVDVSVLFDREVLRFDAFRQEQESPSTVTILEEELRIANVGNNAYTLTFLSLTEAPPSLTLQVRRNEILISEHKLTLESKNQ